MKTPLVLFCLFALSLACERARWDSPVSAYLSFSRAAQKADYKSAYAALSAETRQVLAARAKEISELSGGSIKDDPVLLFFGNALKAQPLSEVKLEKSEGDHATIRAAAGGQVRTVAMVHEAGGWKVELLQGPI